MRFPTALLTTLVVAVLSVVTPGQALSTSHRRNGHIAGAAYSMTNDPQGNNIIIYTIAHNGTVSFVGSAPTGGKGEHGIESPGPDPLPDATFTQAPLVISGTMMYAVNPGSNTISLFSINPNDPTKLKMIGSPANTNGDFPSSIAVHPDTGNVYVLNSGKVNGVQLLKPNGSRGLKPVGPMFELHVNETTPPTGPLGSISQVLFNTDATKLRVAVKGDGHIPGYLGTWDVASDGSLGNFVKTMASTLAASPAPFGMVNIPDTEDAVFVSDAGIGATVYDFSTSPVDITPTIVQNQTSSCWVQYSEESGSYWVADTGGFKLYEMTVDVNTPPLQANLVNTIELGTNNTPTELAVATVNGNQYLYVLSPEDETIDVLALQPNQMTKIIQQYKFGDIARSSGLMFSNVNLEGINTYII